MPILCGTYGRAFRCSWTPAAHAERGLNSRLALLGLNASACENLRHARGSSFPNARGDRGDRDPGAAPLRIFPSRTSAQPFFGWGSTPLCLCGAETEPPPRTIGLDHL